jgi:predicted amidohydrolase YtcJ
MAADVAVVNATVHTMEPGRPPAVALAVRGETLLAVGDADDVRAHIGPRTEVVDARGGTVTPGLVDCHQHPLLGLDAARGVALSAARTVDELRQRLKEEVAVTTPGGWVIGYGVDYNAFAAERLHRRVIDDVLDGHPAFLWMADVHSALMNTAGLAAAGITGPVTFADRSEIVVDADGPTGELREWSATLRGYAAVPAMPADEAVRRLAALFAAQNRTGVTGVHIPDGWPATVPSVLELADADRLTVRVHLAPWCLPDTAEETLDRLWGAPRQGRLWRLAGAKFFLDGAIEGGTAWLSHPDALGQNRAPQWRDPAGYTRAVARAVAAGLPAWTHAIGDRAVTAALDTYAAVGRPAAGRHRIEHLEVVADADVPRFAALDVVASMQPTHMDWSLPDRSDLWSRRIGARSGQAWRYRDVLAHAGVVAFGSDWPISAHDPRPILAGAQLRRPAGVPGRAPYGPGQALTAAQALAGFTTAAAYAVGEEHRAGRLLPGHRADLALWAGDPLRCPPDDLPALPVWMTVVDGRVVHREVV